MRTNKIDARIVFGIISVLIVLLSLVMITSAQSSASGEATPAPKATATAGKIKHGTIGFSNCLKCHLDGFREAPIMPGDDHATYNDNDVCLDCHEPNTPEDGTVWKNLLPGSTPVPIQHPASNGLNTCYDCHLELGDQLTDIAQMWIESVHGKAGIGCADCHGGDPNTDEMKLAMQTESGYIGVPPRLVTPQICGGCHSDVERMRSYKLPTDQYAKYTQSVHGKKLRQNNDTRVAICTDCHGSHNVKKGSDSTAPIYPVNVPELCAGCHADTTLMESYGIPTNQYEVYKSSVHGKLLLEEQDVRAPTCASCHGSHDAKPPTSDEVVNVCGKCHTATEDLYGQSLHSRIGDNAPKCWTCHGTHDVFKTGEEMFMNHKPQEDKACTSCHLDNKSFRMDKARFAQKEDRRCDTCHHEGSRIMRQVTGIYVALNDANTVYEETESAIKKASALGMIVTDAEIKLREARTSLISARAAVHTTKLPVVTKFTDEVETSAEVAKTIADGKLQENFFRRFSMIIAVVIIIVIIITLSYLKRKIDRELEKES